MHPDVLLVEKSVARSAQEALLRKGISLVLNVKPKLLERLARCTGAQVAPSVEHLNHACVAFCKEFAVDSLVRTCSPMISSQCQPDAISIQQAEWMVRSQRECTYLRSKEIALKPPRAHQSGPVL